MRKLIICNIISLDGFYEGPGKDVMALPFDEAFDDYNSERLRAADTLLLGRTTYEGLRSYWPPIADRSDVRPVEREISRLTTAIDKVVVSDTLGPQVDGPWPNPLIVKRADAHRQVADLKRQQGREIIVFGSHVMWNDLLAAGLVDELHLMIGPAVLAAGTPVFASRPRMPLRLLESRILNDSQLVLARYQPAQTLDG